MSVKKAEVLIRELKEKLAYRLPALSQFDSIDSSGNPVLTLAAARPWVTGGEEIVIRIRPFYALGVNALGIAQESFCPHIVDIITEDDAAGKSFCSDETLENIMFEVSRLGAKLEIYLMPTTTQPDVSGFIAGNLKLSLDDLLNPTLITM